MTLSTDLNNTTFQNLIEALSNQKNVEPVPIVIKLTYDPDTLYVNGITFEDTDLPWIEITRQQFNEGIQFKRLRVENNKLVEVVKQTAVRTRRLVPGNTWKTTKGNMLLIGEDDGWN